MKKILFITALLLSAVVYGNVIEKQETTSIKENKVESVKANNRLGILGNFKVDMNNVTFPWTISVPAPPIDVVEFEGPCGANAGIMTVSNGTLTITFQNNAGILDLYDFKDTFEIKIRTKDFDYYSIFIETI